nr:anaphase-promoting complex subunit 5 isoform X2 [Tanacetum cinerariifolium]
MSSRKVSSHVPLFLVVMQHVQRPLLSFGPKASIQLKTNLTIVCKQLRASSQLIYQFDNENTVMTIDGALSTSWLKNRQKEATSLVFPDESGSKSNFKLQLLHEHALHRGHLKLAKQICDELGVLASSVVGRSNGSGNGDPFLDDLVDIGQDIGEGNKAMVRSKGIHRGRCGSNSSSAIGEGDVVANELYKESSQCRRALCDGLLDYDESIHQKVVTVLSNLACHTLSSILPGTIKLVADGLHDTSVYIKKDNELN